MNCRCRRALLLCAIAALPIAAFACDEGTRPGIAPANPLADSADQVLFGIRANITDQGLLRAQLEADTGYFFEGNSRLELRNEKTTFFKSTGQVNAVLTSREGTFNTARSQMQARKNVVVTTTDGRRLETSVLNYNQATDQISSDSPFVFTEPGRELHGIGFVSDPNMTHVQVKKVTTGQGPIELPGQSSTPATPPPTPPSRRRP